MHEDVAIGALQRRAGDDGALAAPCRPGRSRRQWPAARPAVLVGKRMARAHLGDIARRVKPVAVLIGPVQACRPACRRWCSCPSRTRPSPPARRASCRHRPRKFSGSAAAIAPARPSRRCECARFAGRSSPVEHARQDRALVGARDFEQHFAAGASAGSVSVTAARTARHGALGTPTTQRLGLVDGGIAGKQRGGMAVGADAHQHQIEQRTRPGSSASAP